MKYLALISATQKDGTVSEIIAGSEVDSPEAGELWFGENKPEDGTQVDYILIDWSLNKAAPFLLEVCEEVTEVFKAWYLNSGRAGQSLYKAREAIAIAKSIGR
jgi:hypothetical protein